MKYHYYVLTFTIILLSPFPFVSSTHWNEDAFAQVGNASSSFLPPFGQNITNTRSIETFVAYNNTNVESVNVVNITATNMAHDQLLKVRDTFIELNNTSQELNKTLSSTATSILNNASALRGSSIFGSLAISTDSISNFNNAVTSLQNGTTEYANIQQNLTSQKNQFKISPHVISMFNNTNNITVYVNLISDDSIIQINELEFITRLNNIIVATLSESRIQELSKSDVVQSIQLPNTVVSTVGSVISEGVEKSNANLLHQKGITGKNVTIAIIDVTFDPTDSALSSHITYSALFRSCDNLLCGQTGGTSGQHGTRVSHIVADMAPDADLELYSVSNDIGIIQAISHIISRGTAEIITMSLNVPTSGGDGSTKHFRDGTSIVARAVDRARDAGILVTISSGNTGDNHWAGKYTASTTVTPNSLNLDSYQSVLEVDASASGLQQVCLPFSSNKNIILSWDAWDQSPVQDDYDLFVFDSTMTQLLSYSTEWQPIGINPLESTPAPSSPDSKCIVVASKVSSQDHNLHIYGATSPTSIPAGSLGTPADARGALAVGAVDHVTGTLEDFSSYGPTDDGRIKPEICGYDRISTPVNGVPTTFFGTSAAAPHVAGMGALLLDANPFATPNDIQSSIENSATAIPIGCGSGLMSLSDAAQIIPNVTINGGSNHPYVKTGDSLRVTIETNNTISSVNATILGRSVSANIIGNTVNVSTVVQENDTQGSADFEIRALDNLGNMITATPQIFPNASINVDTVSPHLVSAYASSNSTIMVVFNENILQSSVSASDFVFVGHTINTVAVSENTVQFNTSIFDISSIPNVTLSGSIEDLAGNMAPSTSISPIVGFGINDTVAQKLVSLNISSSYEDTTFAKTGDNITIILTTDEPISSHNATILNKIAQTNVTDNVLIASISVEDSDSQGPVDFILNITDTQNNTLHVTQENLTFNNVIVDTIPPNLTVHTSVGNVIVLNFSESLHSDSVANTRSSVSELIVFVVEPFESEIRMSTSTFAANATPIVNINGFVADLAGNTFLNDTQRRNGGVNITASDKISPSITSIRPLNTTAIEIQFNEPLDASSVISSNFEINNDIQIQTTSLSSSDTVVNLLTTNFDTNASLSVLINGTITDTSGNPVIQNTASPFSSAFTAQRLDTSTIELSFTLGSTDVSQINSTSFNTSAFSITNPNMMVQSWNLLPSFKSSALISDFNTNLVLENYDYFGTSLASSDFDNDGTLDLVVSSPGNDAGELDLVYLNSDGTSKSFLRLNSSTISSLNFNSSDGFGRSLTTADFNNDTTYDIAVGSPGDNSSNMHYGKIHIVYLNSNGSVNSVIEINSTTANGPRINNTDIFGASITSSDFNDDGIADLAIGAPGYQNNSGAIHIVYLNQNGSVNSTLTINSSTTNGPLINNLDYFGQSIASSDFNDDGIADLAIGAPGYQNNFGATHIVYMNSDGSINNTLVISIASASRFGEAMSALDDVDGDGRNDLIVSALHQNEGFTYILNPKENNIQVTTPVRFNYGFGTSLAHIGDTSDGEMIIATGIPFSSRDGGIDRGTVLVMFFEDHLIIKTDPVADTGLTPMITYDKSAQSDLVVDNILIPDSINAIASDEINPTIVSIKTVDEFSVEIVFSETINETSVNASNFLINNTNPHNITVAANVVTLASASSIGPGDTPPISFTGSILDLAGNAAVLSSTNATDGIRPAFFLVTTPHPNKVVVSFTEQINTSSLSTGDFQVDGVNIISIQTDASGTVLTMTTDIFATSTTLRALVDVKDLSGNNLLLDSAPITVAGGRPSE